MWRWRVESAPKKASLGSGSEGGSRGGETQLAWGEEF